MRVGTLFALIPMLAAACDSGPIPSGEIVTATLKACGETGRMLPERVQYWRQSIEHQPVPPPVRPGWEASVSSMLLEYPGVLLTVHVSRQATVVRDRTLGQTRGISVEPWRETDRDEHVYSVEFGTDCELYPVGLSGTFYLSHMGGSGLPPEHLAAFLGVKQLMRVPSPFRGIEPPEVPK